MNEALLARLKALQESSEGLYPQDGDEQSSGPLASVAGGVGNAALTGLGWLGTIFDTPGSVVRGMLSLKPLRAIGGILYSPWRVSGKEMMGIEDDQNSIADDAAGIAAELATDPLSYFGIGAVARGAGLAGKAGQIASKAGYAATRVGSAVRNPRTGELIRGALTANRTNTLGKIAKEGGEEAVSKILAAAEKTQPGLLKRGAQKVLPREWLEKVGAYERSGPELAAAIKDQLAKGSGGLIDEPLSAGVGGVTWGEKAYALPGLGSTAATRKADRAIDALMYGWDTGRVGNAVRGAVNPILARMKSVGRSGPIGDAVDGVAAEASPQSAGVVDDAAAAAVNAATPSVRSSVPEVTPSPAAASVSPVAANAPVIYKITPEMTAEQRVAEYARRQELGLPLYHPDDLVGKSLSEAERLAQYGDDAAAIAAEAEQIPGGPLARSIAARKALGSLPSAVDTQLSNPVVIRKKAGPLDPLPVNEGIERERARAGFKSRAQIEAEAEAAYRAGRAATDADELAEAAPVITSAEPPVIEPPLPPPASIAPPPLPEASPLNKRWSPLIPLRALFSKSTAGRLDAPAQIAADRAAYLDRVNKVRYLEEAAQAQQDMERIIQASRLDDASKYRLDAQMSDYIETNGMRVGQDIAQNQEIKGVLDRLVDVKNRAAEYERQGGSFVSELDDTLQTAGLPEVPMGHMPRSMVRGVIGDDLDPFENQFKAIGSNTRNQNRRKNPFRGDTTSTLNAISADPRIDAESAEVGLAKWRDSYRQKLIDAGTHTPDQAGMVADAEMARIASDAAARGFSTDVDLILGPKSLGGYEYRGYHHGTAQKAAKLKEDLIGKSNLLKSLLDAAKSGYDIRPNALKSGVIQSASTGLPDAIKAVQTSYDDVLKDLDVAVKESKKYEDIVADAKALAEWFQKNSRGKFAERAANTPGSPGMFSTDPIQNVQSYIRDAVRAGSSADAVIDSMVPLVKAEATQGTVTLRKALEMAGIRPTHSNPGLVRKLTDAGLISDPSDAGEFAQLINASHVEKGDIEQLVGVVNKFSAPQEVGPLTRFLDSATNLFRFGALATPRFHVRNRLSGATQNAMTGELGLSRAGADDIRSLLRTGNIEGAAERYGATLGMPGASDLEVSEAISRKMMANDILPEHAHQAAETSGQQYEMLAKKVPGLVPEGTLPSPGEVKSWLLSAVQNPKGTVKDTLQRLKSYGGSYKPWEVRGVGGRKENDFILGRLQDDISSRIEKVNRGEAFLNALRQGVQPEVAADAIRSAHVDYSNISDFERDVMRRIFPFYTYGRRMAQHTAGELLGPNPAYRSLLRAQASMQDDETAPEFLRNTLSIPLGSDESGTESYITSLGLMPEESFQLLGSPMAGPRGVGEELAPMLNPIIKTPVELLTGRSMFHAGPGGGRDLRDTDPAVGRLIANILGSETPLQTQGLVDSIAMNTIPSVVNQLKTATDPNKSLLSRLMQLSTGARVYDLTPAKRDAIEREALNEAMRVAGARTIVRPYMPENVLEKLSPSERRVIERMLQLQKSLDARAKERKKERELKEAAK